MSVLSKIITGIMVAGSSVLSILVPPAGVPLLGLSIGAATNAWTTDKVSASGQALANGTASTVNSQALVVASTTAAALERQALYEKYLSQGYSAQTAATMSGMSSTGMSSTAMLPDWLIYAGIGLLGFFILKKFKLFK